jgi:CheY-like chemotaxis protein
MFRRDKKKILYVEDDQCMQSIVAALLNSTHSYELLVSDSGMDALDDLRRFEPDLIMLDVMMPGLAGTHTLHVIRTMPEYRDTPVIFVTSKTDPQDLALYKKLGAAAVVSKPFKADILLGTIEKLCNQGPRSVAARL